MISPTVRPRKRAGGFTMSELLIVLMILGLLAAFGLPAALRYSQTNRAAAAQHLLRQIAAQEAQWLSLHQGYADLAQLGYPAESSLGSVYMDEEGATLGYASRTAVYRISLRISHAGTDGTGPYYLLTAEPMNRQASETRCGTLSLAATGQTGATGTASEAGCWR